MTSTRPPRDDDERTQLLEAECRAALHALGRGRLQDAIGMLLAALVQCGALRSRYRMLTAPGDVIPAPDEEES